MYSKRLCTAAFLLLIPVLHAQFDPDGAQVISYFPQLADGGTAVQQWISSFTFVNPHPTFFSAGEIFLYGNDGSPLRLDFGTGAVSSFTFTVPPQGTVSFKSSGASPTIVTGWAIVYSTLPLEGVVQYRFAVNGVPQQGVSAQSTKASPLFRSPATFATGIAIANVYTGSLPINIAALDANGNTVAKSSVTLNALGHTSFTLGQIFPSLPATFRGTVLIAPQIVATDCVAWTLSDDLGVLASYPPAGLNWPISQFERIWKVWEKVLNVAATSFQLGTLPTLVIDATTTQINSFANPTANEVHIFLNLAELISDSESELSFVVAHEMGHIIQARIGKLQFIPTNIEQDADQYGMLLSLVAGYDPYGAAGALAKLSMASGQAGLVAQNFDNLLSDPHGSFNDRLALIFAVMQTICVSPTYQSSCAAYKATIHPHLPAISPLVRSPGGV